MWFNFVIFVKNNTMKYIEVDIYMNQLVSFFEKNPNDLISLIGELQKDDFYKIS